MSEVRGLSRRNQYQSGAKTWEQINAGSFLRIADVLEQAKKWGSSVKLCTVARAIPRIARALEKPLVVRHELVLRIELPWLKKRKRGKR
jgi:hypothetical protein